MSSTHQAYEDEESDEDDKSRMTLKEILDENVKVIKVFMAKFEDPLATDKEKLRAMFEIHMNALLTGFCLKKPDIAVQLYVRGTESGETFFSTKCLLENLYPLFAGKPVSWREVVDDVTPVADPQ